MATCHHLSGTMWRKHCSPPSSVNSGQRRRTTINGGQRRPLRRWSTYGQHAGHIRQSSGQQWFSIVTQVANNVNNANNGNGGNGGGGNGNGRNNRCTFKAFQSCNPKEYDGKGGAIVLTRWIKKMENVIDNSGCAENQNVRYTTSLLVNKALTWWNTQVQARGRVAAMAMTWNDFKALMVEGNLPML
ncbi:hypothetical protein Tco_0764710 [Tanacetum coccineum]